VNVLLIYPRFPDTYWSFRYALSFQGKRAAQPPLGLITVAALLPHSWDKRLVDTNVERLRDRDLAWADVAFIGGMHVPLPAPVPVADHLCQCACVPAVTVASGDSRRVAHQLLEICRCRRDAPPGIVWSSDDHGRDGLPLSGHDQTGPRRIAEFFADLRRRMRQTRRLVVGHQGPPVITSAT
jgi:hypothetical protein